MGIRPGDARAFFAPTERGTELLAERSALIDAFPDRHIAVVPEGEEVLREFLETVEVSPQAGSPHDVMRQIGRMFEPDVLLLRRGTDAELRLVAGALCFPSSWSLQEKMGLTLKDIHAVVPGLQAELGQKIDRFLSIMKPGSAWERANWGLSGFPDGNQHTDLCLPRLSADAPPEDAWLRAEHQLLMPLPKSNGVAFGIRLQIARLGDLVCDPQLLRSMHRQLQTIPPAVAAYKGIAAVREAIATWAHSQG